jgi:hypothetical protein
LTCALTNLLYSDLDALTDFRNEAANGCLANVKRLCGFAEPARMEWLKIGDERPWICKNPYVWPVTRESFQKFFIPPT